ncbi:uncharacterized protein LOC117639909 isoform X3 [Thrips palmi]|uniref:Uncharacterized protein LOC117639909 isoform X3 n=1 Tax=Thrips palmi TaxID=161013 RepID=A0A6P8XXL3_THRPL|nr:uncharacterized protein LOC117639909 isoform X3 [Thrips palmi]
MHSAGGCYPTSFCQPVLRSSASHLGRHMPRSPFAQAQRNIPFQFCSSTADASSYAAAMDSSPHSTSSSSKDGGDFCDVHDPAKDLPSSSRDGGQSAAEPNTSEDGERWWCDDCAAVATAPCLESHSVLTTAAARSTLLARMAPAVKAARAANRRLANLQRLQDSFEESLADRGPRLVVSFEGWYDKWECGILDGTAPIGLLTTEAALSAHDYDQELCRVLADVELTLDLEKEELGGWCSLPRDLLDHCFPLRPPGQDLRPGAVLCDYEQITIFMRRCPAKTGAGKRLLGYVEKAGLRALTADRGPCVGQCAKPCVFCDDDIVIVLKRARLDKGGKRPGGRGSGDVEADV